MPLEKIFHIARNISTQSPLILNLTNYVVMNHTANGLLALGASPIMSEEIGEIDELVKMSDSLVINIGTLNDAFIERAIFASERAKIYNKPVVLDPVGAGASRIRRKTSQSILKTGAVSILKGNASEIIALAAPNQQGHGVDSIHTSHDAALTAKKLTAQYGITVGVSDATDIIVNQERTAFVSLDVPMMKKITGMGCMASAICGACLAVEEDSFLAAFAAMFIMSVAGSQAVKQEQNISFFVPHFFNSLNDIEAHLSSYIDRVHI